MNKRATIKDIAKKAGVSIGSVHFALRGKAGVSDATRKRILEIAAELQYQPNNVAVSLKRKSLRIAVVFPGPSADNRFYFTQVWGGVQDYMNSLKDYNLEVVNIPYYNKRENNQVTELLELESGKPVDGLLTVGYMDANGLAVLRRFVNKGTAVVLVGNHIRDAGCICSVLSPYDVIGRTMAEQLTRQISVNAEILLCAGDVMIPSHHEIVLGFNAFLQENGLENPVYTVHSDAVSGNAFEQIKNTLLAHPTVSACCSVNARSSVMLGGALVETGRAGRIPAIGSDLFPENIQFLKDGVFTNLVHKNPYLQSHLAAKTIVNALVYDIHPTSDVLFVGSEMVFKSNLRLYEPDGRSYWQIL